MAKFGRRHIIAIANGFISARPETPVWGPTEIERFRYAAVKGMMVQWEDTIAFVAGALKDSDEDFSEEEFIAMIKLGQRIKDDA